MKSWNNSANFWFLIEPYVYIKITNNCVLLYNTLDGVTLESAKTEVIQLINNYIKKENCGVILLSNDQYSNNHINDFISELREKYMGDIINVNLSNEKPVQILPYFNFLNDSNLYKKHNFLQQKDLFDKLSQINIHVDSTTSVTKLVTFLLTIQGSLTFNIIGNMAEVENYNVLLSFFNQHTAPKTMISSYKDVIALQPTYENDFSYQISSHFPVNMQQWNKSRMILIHQTLPIEYVFDVTSDEDCIQAENIVEKSHIEKYRLNPVYTGDNISFFEENVFLHRKDILFIQLTIKDIFARQAMNIYDFGKINIMPNGDVYANVNFPSLGNIETDNIYEIIQKEIEEGKSWFRIRNHAPCDDCVYQWLCPSPSNYEIEIGRPNLCHVRNL